MQLQLPGQPAAEQFDIAKDANLNNVHHAEHATAALPTGEGEWSIKIRRDIDADFQSLPVDDINDVFVIIHFETS